MQVVRLAGYQVIDTEQSDLRGCEVEIYSEGKKEIAMAKVAMAFVLEKMDMQDAEGVFLCYSNSESEKFLKFVNKSRLYAALGDFCLFNC